MYFKKLALLGAFLFLVGISSGDQVVSGQDEPVDQEEPSARSTSYSQAQAQPLNLTAYIASLFGPIPSAPPISSYTRPLTLTPQSTTADHEDDDDETDDEPWTRAPKKYLLNSTTSTPASSKKSKNAPPPNNPFNISFKDRDVSTYLDYVRNHVSFHYQLAYLDSLSDLMRSEGKFLSEDYTIEFGQVLFNVLETHKNSTDEVWSKKTERKIIRRFLKFILAINPDKFLAGKPIKSMGDGCESYEANFKWLSKSFFELLLAHNITEGYEILMEVLIIRNANLTLEQLQDMQCLYYSTWGGLRDGKSYLFPAFDSEWFKRNELFNRTVLTSSIKNIVEATISEDDSGPKRKPSPELLQMLSVFSEVLQKVEQERKRVALSQPLQFHKLVQRLEPKFLALAKTDNFIDLVDTKDLFASTVAEAVMETLVRGNGTLVFKIESRQDLSALHQLRLAGVPTVYYAHEDFWKVQIVKRVRDLYSNGGRFRHLFTNAIRQIRLFPLGPMLLQGCETLNQLMLQTPPRDAESSKSRIENFATTLGFLQAMWSRDDFTVHSLSEQVQILTEHGVNQLLKLMIIIPATSGNNNSETSFAEVGVRRNSTGPDELVVVPIRSDRDDEDAGLQTLWQVHLGWVKSSSEAYIEPTIKMKIMLAGDVDGELTVDEKENKMTYKQGFQESKGFWDLALTRGSTAFQLIYHDGGLESFFQLEGDPDQGVTLRPKHFMMHQLPESFIPAQFFAVPADE